jgi:microcystin-dependent protein
MINDNNTVPSKLGGTQINTVTDLNGNPSTSAHRVNEVTASVVGSGNASATGSVALTSANLPDHTHTLKSAAGVSYYAGSSPGSASDSASGATAGYGLSGSSTGSGIPNTGIVNGATGSGINVMNPYQTINYIIFTGKI